MDAAVAALIGAGVGATIGAVSSAANMWFQQCAQTQRELVKVAVDLAVVDYKRLLEHADHKGKLVPISLYVSYHADLMRAIADGTFDEVTIERLDAKQERLARFLFAKESVRRAARAGKAE